jgi:hypothetical protein
MQAPLPKYRRRAQASEYVQNTWGIPCSIRWLAKLAVEGGGPIFHKVGRFPMYAPTDLDGWAEGRVGRAQRSTSDSAQQPLQRSTWVVDGR